MKWNRFKLLSSDPRPRNRKKIPVKQLGLATGQAVVVRVVPKVRRIEVREVE